MVSLALHIVRRRGIYGSLVVAFEINYELVQH